MGRLQERAVVKGIVGPTYHELGAGKKRKGCFHWGEGKEEQNE